MSTVSRGETRETRAVHFEVNAPRTTYLVRTWYAVEFELLVRDWRTEVRRMMNQKNHLWETHLLFSVSATICQIQRTIFVALCGHNKVICIPFITNTTS
jgi:hypothetical protein